MLTTAPKAPGDYEQLVHVKVEYTLAPLAKTVILMDNCSQNSPGTHIPNITSDEKSLLGREGGREGGRDHFSSYGLSSLCNISHSVY